MDKISYVALAVSGAVSDKLRAWKDKWNFTSYVSGSDVVRSIVSTCMITHTTDEYGYAESLRHAYFPGKMSEEMSEELEDILVQVIRWMRTPLTEIVALDMEAL